MQAVNRLRTNRGVRLLSSECGMSILELLAAVLIGLLVVSAAMDAYLTLHTQSVMQDDVTEMQQSGRAAMRVLSNRLRMAGFGLPSTLVSLDGRDANPDTITIWHMDADGCEATTTQAMPAPSDDIICSGWDLDCFTPGMRAYVFDASAGTGEYFTVNQVHSSPERLVHSGLSRAYPAGARVSFIRETKFYLDRSDSLHPMFIQEEFGAAPEPYADNIEDLQFQYIMATGDTESVPVIPAQVRRVLVNLVARTPNVDDELENDYHRRNYNFQISVRNNE